MKRRLVEVVPVIEVELCPECGSDMTQVIDAQKVDVGESHNNRCDGCGNHWKSPFPSGSGVAFIRREKLDEQELLG